MFVCDPINLLLFCSTLTMPQLLDTLIVKAKLECEEAHRKLLFALNGQCIFQKSGQLVCVGVQTLEQPSVGSSFCVIWSFE